jgi:hypothetical protein
METVLLISLITISQEVSGITPEEYVDLPITVDNLREVVLNEGIPSDFFRRFWWPILVTLSREQTLERIPDTRSCSKRKYMMAIEHSKEATIPIDLSWDEDIPENIAFHVMKLLVEHYVMEDPGLVYPLVKFISQVITNTAICYMFFSHIMDRPHWYIQLTPTAHRCHLGVFRELAQRGMTKTYGILQSIGAFEEKYLNMIFVDFFTEILPDEYIKCIVSACPHPPSTLPSAYL